MKYIQWTLLVIFFGGSIGAVDFTIRNNTQRVIDFYDGVKREPVMPGETMIRTTLPLGKFNITDPMRMHYNLTAMHKDINGGLREYRVDLMEYNSSSGGYRALMGYSRIYHPDDPQHITFTLSDYGYSFE